MASALSSQKGLFSLGHWFSLFTRSASPRASTGSFSVEMLLSPPTLLGKVDPASLPPVGKLGGLSVLNLLASSGYPLGPLPANDGLWAAADATTTRRMRNF